MDQWASRRKNLYLLGIVLVLTTVSFLVFWKFWYQAPTCFDGVKNGDETGVDCGGACSLICSAGILKPIVRWDPRTFEVSPGVWSVLIYVENPNINAVATYAPYTFTLYDEKNNVLSKREGATILPSHKTVGIFEGNISIKQGVRVRRAEFEFGKEIVWQKIEDTDEELVVSHSPILRLDTMPRVEANVKNKTFNDIKNIELIAAIFDGSDNVIAASRTFIENLGRNEDTDVFFTWPKTFDLGSKVCENPANVVLLLDRSGSMSSLGTNPPQPLTDAKKAAVSFVERMSIEDRVAVVSFATKASNPIDLDLTNDLFLAKSVIDKIAIATGTTQYTNIYESLYSAWQELSSQRILNNASKVIILLTDGVATNPKNPNGGTEADDIKYAEGLALGAAKEAKDDNILIYTIGLGDSINAEFLKQVASETDHYFFAPDAQKLENIYKNISSDICEEIPARVEITYKVFGKEI